LRFTLGYTDIYGPQVLSGNVHSSFCTQLLSANGHFGFCPQLLSAQAGMHGASAPPDGPIVRKHGTNAKRNHQRNTPTRTQNQKLTKKVKTTATRTCL
jgi:hypothetical protein